MLIQEFILISVSRVGSFINLIICRILDKIFTIKPFLSMFNIGQIIKYINIPTKDNLYFFLKSGKRALSNCRYLKKTLSNSVFNAYNHIYRP